MNQTAKNILLTASVGLNIALGITLDNTLDLVYTKDNQIVELQEQIEKNREQIESTEITVNNLRLQLDDMVKEREALSIEYHRLREQVSRGGSRVHTMECTAYTHTGYLTASGTYPVAGRTVASNDFPLGTRLRINGNIYIVEDTGGMGNGVIDIFMDSHSECVEFGRQTLQVEILH